MKIEILGNIGNTLIAVSVDNDSSVTLAFTDETTLSSVTIIKANVKDFQYLTERFNICPTDLIGWLKGYNLDILEVLPD
jgi:hypothetical protein